MKTIRKNDVARNALCIQQKQFEKALYRDTQHYVFIYVVLITIQRYLTYFNKICFLNTNYKI